MTIARLHIDEARDAVDLMRAQSERLTWLSVDLSATLRAAAETAGVVTDAYPSRAVTDVAAFVAAIAADLDRRTDVFIDADRAVHNGFAEVTEALVNSLMTGELPISPGRAFDVIETRWAEIGGNDGTASWSDFERLRTADDDPAVQAAVVLWGALLFDLVEAAADDRRVNVGRNGLDGRRDGRLTLDDIRSFRRRHHDIDVWWTEREARRAALLPHVLTGDEALDRIIGAWEDIGGGDGLADWGDLEAHYRRSADPHLRASIDLLRGPLFERIEVANDGTATGLDARGRDRRLDGKVHIDDFGAFLDTLGDLSVDEYMADSGIEPPVLRVADPHQHIEKTSIVVFSGAIKGAVAVGGVELGYRVHSVIDGSYIVERVDGASGGIEAGVGATAELRWGDQTKVGGSVIAKAGAVATAHATSSWLLAGSDEVRMLIVAQAMELFPAGEAARDAFDATAETVDTFTPEAVEDGVGFIVGAVPVIGERIVKVNDEIHRHLRYDSPTPYSQSTAATASSYGKVAVEGRGSGVSLEGDFGRTKTITSYAHGEHGRTTTVFGSVSGRVVIGNHPILEPRNTRIDEQHGVAARLSVEHITTSEGRTARVVVTVSHEVDDELRTHTITYDGAISQSRAAGEDIAVLTSGGVSGLVDAYNALAGADSIPGVTIASQSFSVDSADYGFTLEGELGAVAGLDVNVATVTIRPTGR